MSSNNVYFSRENYESFPKSITLRFIGIRMNTAYMDMQALTTTERSHRVLQMRNERKTYDEIALELGVSHDTVRRDYLLALQAAKDTRLALAHVALDDSLAMIDNLIARHMDKITQEKHAMVILRAIDMRNKLLGLYPQGDTSMSSAPSITINYNGVHITLDHAPTHDTGDSVVQGHILPAHTLPAGDTLVDDVQPAGSTRGAEATPTPVARAAIKAKHRASK